MLIKNTISVKNSHCLCQCARPSPLYTEAQWWARFHDICNKEDFQLGKISRAITPKMRVQLPHSCALHLHARLPNTGCGGHRPFSADCAEQVPDPTSQNTRGSLQNGLFIPVFFLPFLALLQLDEMFDSFKAAEYFAHSSKSACTCFPD